MALNERPKRPLVYGAAWLTGQLMEKWSRERGIWSVPSLLYQQRLNVVGWTLKCSNGLHGPLTIQASIKGVSGAWLEQCDPLGLMSAVQGTVGCSSSSQWVFIYVIYPWFRQEGGGFFNHWPILLFILCPYQSFVGKMVGHLERLGHKRYFLFMPYVYMYCIY